MSIDPASPTPVFQQIAEHVQRLVAAGVFRPGELSPSVRAMALELQVNPNTVQRAYQTLEADGLVAGRKGIGMVVTNDGATTARGRSLRVVRNTFRQGIRAGRAAAIPPEHIRDSFDEAMRDHDEETKAS